MVKRKHPQDRAERLRINEEKKASDGYGSRIKRILDTTDGSLPSDRKDI